MTIPCHRGSRSWPSVVVDWRRVEHDPCPTISLNELERRDLAHSAKVDQRYVSAVFVALQKPGSGPNDCGILPEEFSKFCFTGRLEVLDGAYLSGGLYSAAGLFQPENVASPN